MLAGDAHLTVILGAGASVPSGLPTWDQFARRLAVISGLVKTEDAARTLLRKQDPTIVLEAVRSRSGARWSANLDSALYGGLADDPEPSPLHLAAAGHYLASPRATTLATLNFDTLLESAILSTGAREVVARLAEEFDPKTEDLAVHHLHGAVLGGRAYSPVVGYRDFAELVADDHAWQHTFLRHALERGPLLLAGTSYRDPDIRHWLHLVVRDERPRYPALVTIVREGLALDRQTFEEIDEALAFEWESIGLRALRMHDLADIALVLRELRFIGEPAYRAPNERARQVWDSHARRFRRLQREYSELLAKDAATITKALGAPAHRGTLWLANARGKLARWATEGIVHGSVRDLKLVPTGHDSPWIAGEAIGAEGVKVRDVEREQRVTPTWRSVLAVPVFVGDGELPDFTCAVLTFGLAQSAGSVVSQQERWWHTVEELSDAWGGRLSGVAFSPRHP